MTNILVTGGAGFIGSNFVRYMVNKYSDYHIINLDALTYCGTLKTLQTLRIMTTIPLSRETLGIRKSSTNWLVNAIM